MKRCYFFGIEVLDTTLPARIMEELEKLLVEDDQLELWFYHFYHSFTLTCLSCAVLLQSRHPDKDIKIIRVFDPTKDMKPMKGYAKTCPCCIPDKNIYTAFMGGAAAQKATLHMHQFHKVERWILHQCDTIITYYYPNLPDPTNTQVKYAKKLPHTTVIEIFEEETKQRMEQLANNLSDKKSQEILHLLNTGKTRREIAQAIGLSASRISHIAQEATCNIQHTLRPFYFPGRVIGGEIKCCWLKGLNNTTLARIENFESLLKFLIDHYIIEEFRIDSQSCNRIYEIILIRYVSKEDIKITVVNQSPQESDKRHYQYMKVYLSDVRFNYESEQCDCLITDFSEETAAVIRKFCTENGNIRLFDISKETVLIDEQYLQQ